MSSSRYPHYHRPPHRDPETTSLYSTFTTTTSVSQFTDPTSSPTDGYFESRDHPSEMFIDTEAANKIGKPKVTISSASSPRYSQERTPLLDSFVGQDGPPPPSYLEATTPMGGWNGRPSGDEGARLLDGRSSFARMGVDSEEERGFVVYKGDGGKWGRRRSLRENCTRKKLLKWIAAILAIIILAAIFAAIFGPKKREIKVSPITPPAQPATSDAPRPSKPKEYPIRWPSRCGKDYNVKSEEMDWGSSSELDITESVHQLDGSYKRVAGWIHITEAPADQAVGTIRAKMSYAVSSSVDVDSIQYASSTNGLTIGDPSFPDGFDGVRKGSACLGISVVVYMAPGVKLENLRVRSTHLGMQIHDGVNFAVSNSTSISLTTGTLDSTSFSSRETHLETISGSISGKYSLFDLLSIRTKSGSVNVNIEPKEAGDSGNKAAVFRADSLSGSIRADFERRSIPDRDYQVSVNTTVGSIDGTFIHGSRTQFSSVAGQINADLLPFSANAPSLLDTSTTDGQTILKLRAPYNAAGSAMGKLLSTHRSISGIIDMTYPQEWEGRLEGSSTSGMLHLQGKDLELLRQDENPGLNHVEAKKGSGESSMLFNTVSGACEVKIGKL